MGVCGAPGSWCEQTSQHNAHPLRDQGWAPKGYPGVSAVPAFLPEKGNSVQAPTDCYENAKSYQCLPLSVRCKISSQIGKFNSILSATSSQGAVEPWPKPDCRSQRQPAPYFPSPQPAALQPCARTSPTCTHSPSTALGSAGDTPAPIHHHPAQTVSSRGHPCRRPGERGFFGTGLCEERTVFQNVFRNGATDLIKGSESTILAFQNP